MELSIERSLCDMCEEFDLCVLLKDEVYLCEYCLESCIDFIQNEKETRKY